MIQQPAQDMVSLGDMELPSDRGKLNLYWTWIAAVAVPVALMAFRGVLWF